ncbi:MAG: hypothetical protein A2Z91_07205 [Deltaproteobacteria bacterium GWA2_38_16]|nr:MAG: hypothetical protein A2Z91_07205 [Deltaproteobacteria bacterium GWA2_38_16]OGQ02697.1 MAG: hypothetical protein A3D19_00540 [Deltaproteobacteria bacterium RIFCSPHIGHO2_02_FULL_38_15]
MEIIKFFIRRRITTLFLNLGILLLGLFCLNKTSIDLFPPINLPSLTIAIPAPGLSSQDIEKKITRPIEEIFNTLPKLNTIRSESQSNQATFQLKFNWGTSIDFAALSVRELLKTISLPEEAESPMIYRWNPSEDPILRVDISSSYSLDKLTQIVEHVIQPQLERISGVATIHISGTLHPEIKVKIDPQELSGRGLNLFQVREMLTKTNLQTQMGTYEEGRYALPIKLNSQFKSIDDIQNLPLYTNPKHPIRLKDIAQITEEFEETKTRARVSKQESIGLSIKKAQNAHTLNVIKAIKETLHAITQKDPRLTLTYSKDDSIYIKTSRSILMSNLWQGSVLTFIVVLIFLRNLIATLIISIAIPISVIGTFALMEFFGVSQNVFSLAGFTLAAGMVVDGAIVILENIYRHCQEEGKSPWRAAVEGTEEIALGVVSSVVTTMAIFIPVVLCIKGIFGILFKDIAFTFTIALALSLIVGFSLIPCACVLFLKREGGVKTLSFLTHPFLTKPALWVQHFFLNTLSHLIDHPKKAFFSITFIYGISFGSIALLPGLDLVPLGEFKNFLIQLKGPKGFPIDKMDQKTMILEEKLYQRPEIKTLASEIGPQTSYLFATLAQGETSLPKADQYLNTLRKELKPPDIDTKIIEFQKLDTTEGYGKPLSLIVRHSDPQIRKSILLQLTEQFKKIPDLIYISTSEEKNEPEIHVSLDHQRLKDQGLTPKEISASIYAHMKGLKGGALVQSEKNDIPIRIIEKEEKEKTLEDLKHLPFVSKTSPSKIIPLETFSALSLSEGETIVEHTNSLPSSTLSSYLKTDRRSLEHIVSDIHSVINQHPTWKDSILIESSLKVFKDTFSDLFIALIIAILLVYMILAAQFESFSQPFILMLTFPLAAVGVLIGVKLWGLYLNVIVMVGIILLVGITCDSGMLLIEYTNILRRRGMDRKEAILTALKHRMRPIFITVLTDVFGTAPMAFSRGAGAEMYQGFGVVTMFGLTAATALTLIATPILYILIEDVSDTIQLKWLWMKTLWIPDQIGDDKKEQTL